MDKQDLTGDLVGAFMKIAFIGFIIGWIAGACAIGFIWWTHA